MIMVPTIYITMLVIVGVLFSTILLGMNSFLNTGKYIPAFKYFYYCIISLTSVGYGDLSPGNDADRIVAIAMSLVGTLHMIIFISVIVSKLNLAPQK
ncbi:potassium channel family protein, partial [Vibrio anguillarum]